MGILPKKWRNLFSCWFLQNLKILSNYTFNQSGAVVQSNTFNYLNADKADAYGLELEFRKN